MLPFGTRRIVSDTNNENDNEIENVDDDGIIELLIITNTKNQKGRV